MNIREAYKILGVSESTNEEDIKKAYRDLVIKHHPDKKGGDEGKMKQINEAYQTIQNPTPQQQEIGFDFGGFGFGSISDIFSRMNNINQHQKDIEPPRISVSISFRESVLGCNKRVKYNRLIKCNSCNGEGYLKLNNSCSNCGGKGKTTIKQGNSIFVQTCNKCLGKVQKNPCNNCDCSGSIDHEMDGEISINSGIKNGNQMRINKSGHFVSNSMFGEVYTDAFVDVIVEKEDNLWMDDKNNVLSNLNISLLEAMTGTSKKIKTAYDEKNINIPALAKNKDQVYIDGCGVKNTGGKHIVIINVEYPVNIEETIEFLKKE